MRTFNTAGPCDPARHYMVPPLERLPEARRLVEQGDYFVLHAPRQSGKTTFLRALSQALNADGKLAALQFSGETGEPTAKSQVTQGSLPPLAFLRLCVFAPLR